MKMAFMLFSLALGTIAAIRTDDLMNRAAATVQAALAPPTR